VPHPVADPAIAMADVSVRFGAARALDGLNLTVPGGAVTALLGPNGAGKSTTVAVITGLRRPDSGHVDVLGGPPGTRAARERVSVMLQEGGLPTGARGPEFVRHIAALRGAAGTADPLIDLLAVPPRTPVRRMSGGERRRTALACALVGSPDVVLLDEPTAGLDVEGREQVWSLIRDLRTRGATVLLSTHHLDEAEALADHVAIVERGRCIAQAPIDDLIPQGREAVVFTSALHLDLGALVEALPAGCTARETAPGRYRVEGDVGPQTLATVTAWCAQHGVTPRSLSIGRLSLLDVYADLTGRANPDEGAP
jgi:ABC-2 type transport system ATP-binding protein